MARRLRLLAFTHRPDGLASPGATSAGLGRPTATQRGSAARVSGTRTGLRAIGENRHRPEASSTQITRHFGPDSRKHCVERAWAAILIGPQEFVRDLSACGESDFLTLAPHTTLLAAIQAYSFLAEMHIRAWRSEHICVMTASVFGSGSLSSGSLRLAHISRHLDPLGSKRAFAEIDGADQLGARGPNANVQGYEWLDRAESAAHEIALALTCSRSSLNVEPLDLLVSAPAGQQPGRSGSVPPTLVETDAVLKRIVRGGLVKGAVSLHP